MAERAGTVINEALAMLAPGSALRHGFERILQAKRGALVVVGDDASVLSICTGGFLLDAEFSPQRLSELAKMDGAIILSADASRIARANVHLMPNPSIPTTETGTRHRTAERVARSIDVPVVSVSAAMGIVTVYRKDDRYELQPSSRIHDWIGQALQTLQRLRSRFDVALRALSALEIEDVVTIRDVAGVLEPVELALRISEDITDRLVELGEDGRLHRLQLDELTDGLALMRKLVVRDYLQVNGAAATTSTHGQLESVLKALSKLSTDQLVDGSLLAQILGIPADSSDPDAPVEPRGYRMLHRIPRFPESVINRIVGNFAGLQGIMRASLADLEKVGGVGENRARAVKDGLSRLAEATILDRYS